MRMRMDANVRMRMCERAMRIRDIGRQRSQAYARAARRQCQRAKSREKRMFDVPPPSRSIFRSKVSVSGAETSVVAT